LRGVRADKWTFARSLKSTTSIKTSKKCSNPGAYFVVGSDSRRIESRDRRSFARFASQINYLTFQSAFLMTALEADTILELFQNLQLLNWTKSISIKLKVCLPLSVWNLKHTVFRISAFLEIISNNLFEINEVWWLAKENQRFWSFTPFGSRNWVGWKFFKWIAQKLPFKKMFSLSGDIKSVMFDCITLSWRAESPFPLLSSSASSQ
jgi:hypothetical protein